MYFVIPKKREENLCTEINCQLSSHLSWAFINLFIVRGPAFSRKNLWVSLIPTKTFTAQHFGSQFNILHTYTILIIFIIFPLSSRCFSSALGEYLCRYICICTQADPIHVAWGQMKSIFFDVTTQERAKYACLFYIYFLQYIQKKREKIYIILESNKETAKGSCRNEVHVSESLMIIYYF